MSSKDNTGNVEVVKAKTIQKLLSNSTAEVFRIASGRLDDW